MFSYLRRGPGFYRRVGGLAVPIILQNLITSTLAMADTFMVGMLGEVPMAAVTLANIPLLSCSYSSLAYRAARRCSSASTGAARTGRPSTGWLAWPCGRSTWCRSPSP